jgi:hypothetical protein
MGRQRLRKCPSRRPCRSTERSDGRRSRITLVQRRGAKSLADDLITGQGVVFGRATSTLRSVETYPLIGRFVFPPVRPHVPRELVQFQCRRRGSLSRRRSPADRFVLRRLARPCECALRRVTPRAGALIGGVLSDGGSALLALLLLLRTATRPLPPRC